MVWAARMLYHCSAARKSTARTLHGRGARVFDFRESTIKYEARQFTPEPHDVRIVRTTQFFALVVFEAFATKWSGGGSSSGTALIGPDFATITPSVQGHVAHPASVSACAYIAEFNPTSLAGDETTILGPLVLRGSTGIRTLAGP